MTDTTPGPKTLLCLASYFKGVDFLTEAKRQGARVLLLTREKTLGEAWPRESLEEVIALPDRSGQELAVQAATELARSRTIDRIVALEEYDVLTAAAIREHLQVPGLRLSEARLFRDKLAMRRQARDASIPVPEFVRVVNWEELNEYMATVPPPWVLKPRSDVSAMGIRKLDSSEAVWRAIETLDSREAFHERSSFFLLERFLPGNVFHVDSIILDGKVLFAGVSEYGRPPMEVAHGGGVFISRTTKHNSAERRELLRTNRLLIRSLGLRRGVTHAEFIQSAADGRFYFLEIGARVGGAYLADVLEAASGINLWREWAKLEVSDDQHPYHLGPARKDHAGIALSLARQEHPDTTGYADPEIAYRVNKPYHVGLIVRSASRERVLDLLDDYARRITEDFSAVVPPRERPE